MKESKNERDGESAVCRDNGVWILKYVCAQHRKEWCVCALDYYGAGRMKMLSFSRSPFSFSPAYKYKGKI